MILRSAWAWVGLYYSSVWLLAQGSDEAEGCCACPPPPALGNPECEWAGFECKNGGGFADGVCAQHVPCEYCRLGNCNNDATWALHPDFYCTCPSGVSGFDCGTIDDAALCPAGTVHDNSFVFGDNAAMTCTVERTAATQLLYLRMHTVTVSLQPGIDGSVDISFQINLRNKRDPPLVWPPERVPPDYMREPLVETCDRAEAIMDCDLRRCTCACPSVMGGRLSAWVGVWRSASLLIQDDVNNTQYQYVCSEGECDTCSGKPDSLCEDGFVAALIKDPRENVKLTFTPLSPGRAATVLDLGLDLLGQIPLTCSTGRCRTSNSSSGPLPEVTSLVETADHEQGHALMAVGLFTAACYAVIIALLRHDKLHSRCKESVGASSSSVALNFRSSSGHLSTPARGLVWQNVVLVTELDPLGQLQSNRVTLEDGVVAKPKQTLLDRISGLVMPGEMLAVMGPTGAGKSTLLNVLTRRLVADTAPAALVAEDATDVSWADAVAFVPQHDCLLATDTVWETLMFVANLRKQPSSPTAASQQRQVEVSAVIAALRLSSRTNTLVGGIDSGGLSGGERKRLSVGIALMLKPAVLVLDEPTSGLDSSSSHTLICCLADLCKSSDTTIVASIHQPSPKNFLSFTNVMLLAPVGRMAYFGAPTAAGEWMAAATGRAKDPAESVCEYLLDSITMDNPNMQQQVVAKFASSAEACALAEVVAKRMPGPSFVSGDSQGGARAASAHQMPVHSQLLHIMARTWRQIARDPALLVLHLVMALAVGVVLGVTFLDLDKELAGIQNRAGFFFMVTLYTSITSMSSLSWFITDRRLKWREWAAGLYGAPALFVSTQTCDLALLRMLPTLCMAVVTYPMIGLHATNAAFLTFVVILLLTAAIATTLNFIYSVLTADIARANLLSVMVFAAAMMFGGLLTNGSRDQAADAVLHLQYASYMYYAWCALMINEFQDIHVLFNPDGFGSVELRGKVFLDAYGVDPTTLWRNVAVLFGFWCFLTAVAAALLRYQVRRR